MSQILQAIHQTSTQSEVSTQNQSESFVPEEQQVSGLLPLHSALPQQNQQQSEQFQQSKQSQQSEQQPNEIPIRTFILCLLIRTLDSQSVQITSR